MRGTAVIGSVFVDVKGFSFGKYIPQGSNVGDVRIVHGGVCRNVAENLANIGQEVSFVTMFETDAIGEDVRRRLAARGVDLTYSVSAHAGMGMWLAVLDEQGNLAGSISRQPDFSSMERNIETRGDEIIRDCRNVVLEIDMNTSIASRVFDIAEKYKRDVYAVVGNMSIILKHPEFLSRTSLFICNEIEAGRLFEQKIDPDAPEKALKQVISEADRRGIREMILTLGKSGAVYYDAVNGASGRIYAEAARMVDSTGAGDAFFAGTIAARMRGMCLENSARIGAHLAALTIQSEESTCPRLPDFFPAEKQQAG